MNWRRWVEQYQKQRHAQQVEKELPMALMEMAIEINAGTRFESIIRQIAQGGYGYLSLELGKAESEMMHQNASVGEALEALRQRVPGRAMNRAITQLRHVYEQGNPEHRGGESLKRLARELLLLQKEASKKYSGKMVVFSLMFIAVSAIVPALFQAFVVVGSVFMQLDFSPLQILLIAAVLFPLLDLAVLLFIRSQKPAGVGG